MPHLHLLMHPMQPLHSTHCPWLQLLMSHFTNSSNSLISNPSNNLSLPLNHYQRAKILNYCGPMLSKKGIPWDENYIWTPWMTNLRRLETMGMNKGSRRAAHQRSTFFRPGMMRGNTMSKETG